MQQVLRVKLEPRHAEVLMLATRMGDISLTLRGVAEAQRSGQGVIATNNIQAAEDASGSVRIYRSGNTEHMNIGGSQ